MARSTSARSWGHWTELKLRLLSEYLAGFQTASASAYQTLYLDLFAGAPDNVSRETGDRIDGSARRAMDTRPKFTALRFFELEPHASQLRADLSARYPGDKRWDVLDGDCNARIGEALQDLSHFVHAPTVAFLDPYAFGVNWSTLEALADFKHKSRKKAELFILLGHGFADRMLNTRSEHMNAKEGEKFTALYGGDDWIPIAQARGAGVLDQPGFSDELVNLLRWRLQGDLGYQYTHTLPFSNTNGKELYDLVFATDHPAGDRIVKGIYNKAAKEGAWMRVVAKDNRGLRRKAEYGELPLPFPEPPAPSMVPTSHLGYTWKAPRKPYGHRSG